MASDIFSTYRQGENRVTATLMAVLSRIALGRTESLLGALLGEDTFQLVLFQNQPKGHGTVPDARIFSSASIWIETKTSKGTLTEHQLRGHLEKVPVDGHLIVLTPDETTPEATLVDKRIHWSSFRNLGNVIGGILADEAEPPTELEGFLLRQFVSLLKADGLLASSRDSALVVAASSGYSDYLDLHAYIFQAHRTFQPVSHIAFYVKGVIKKEVPEILASLDEVTFTAETIVALNSPHQDRLLEILASLKDSSRSGGTHKVLLLSRPTDVSTMTLESEIKNDLAYPFTQGHRYVSLAELKRNPLKTSQLLDAMKNPST